MTQIREAHAERIAQEKRDHAIWYAWGRVDEGSLSLERSPWKFGELYGEMHRDFAMERRTSTVNMQDAWSRFVATGSSIEREG